MGFLRDAAGTLLLQGVAAALQLAAGVLLARGLLEEGRGEYALLILIPNTCLVAVNLGFGSAAMRQVAQRPEAAPRVAANATRLALVAGGATSIVLLAAAPALRALSGGSAGWLAAAAAFASLPVLLYERFANGILIGHRAVLAAHWLRLAQPLAFATLLLLGFAALGRSVDAALYAWAASFALAALLAAWQMRVLVAGERRADRALMREALGFGLQVLPAQVSLWLLYRSDLFLVRAFRPLDEVGVYAQAGALALMFQLLGTSIERAFLPRVLRRARAEADLMTPLVTRCFVLVMAPLAVVAALAAFPLVPLVFGAGFAGAALPFALFLPGLIVGAVGLFCNSYLLGRGHPRHGAISTGLSLALNVALNLLLIPRFGILGAASASLASYSFCGIFLALAYRRITGVRLRELFVPRGADARAILALLRPQPASSR